MNFRLTRNTRLKIGGGRPFLADWRGWCWFRYMSNRHPLGRHGTLVVRGAIVALLGGYVMVTHAHIQDHA